MEPNEIATALASASGGTVHEGVKPVMVAGRFEGETRPVAWVEFPGDGTFWIEEDGEVVVTLDATPALALGIARLVGAMTGANETPFGAALQAYMEDGHVNDRYGFADGATWMLDYLTGADVKDEEGQG